MILAQGLARPGEWDLLYFLHGMPRVASKVAARIFGAARDVGLAKLGGSPTGEWAALPTISLVRNSRRILGAL